MMKLPTIREVTGGKGYKEIAEENSPKTYYFVAGTDEKTGETVVKAVPAEESARISEAYETAEEVARGVEAEAMIQTAKGQLEGVRAGRHGHRSSGSGRVIQQYVQEQQKAEELEQEAEQLQQEAQQLAEERARLEELAKTNPQAYNEKVAEYNRRVEQFQQKLENFNQRAGEYNVKMRKLYLQAAYAAGREYGEAVGYEDYLARENEPVKRIKEQMLEEEKKNPLRAFVRYMAVGVLSWRDPFGLRSVATAAREGHEKAVEVKAEAWYELEQKAKEGPISMATTAATSPWVSATVIAPAVSYSFGYAAGYLQRISPAARFAWDIANVGAAGYIAKRTIIEPYKEGDVPTAIANAGTYLLAAVATRGWYKAGYTRGYNVSGEKGDIISMKLQKLSWKVRTAIAERRIAAMERQQKPLEAIFAERAKPVHVTYVSPEGQVQKFYIYKSASGKDYFVPDYAYRAGTIAIQIPREQVEIPISSEAQLPLREFGPRTMAQQGEIIEPFPRVLYVQPRTIEKQEQMVTQRQRTVQKIIAPAKATTLTLALQKLQLLSIQKPQETVRHKPRTVTGTRQVVTTKQLEIQQVKPVQIQKVNLAQLAMQKLQTLQLQKVQQISRSQLRFDLVVPRVFFGRRSSTPHKVLAMRGGGIRMRLPRIKLSKKSVLPDPISKMLTEIRFGRPATAPAPTRKVWQIAERSLYMFVPTAEMLHGRRPRKKKRRSYKSRR